MSSITIDLFAEDRAHEAFLEPLVQRLCMEERQPVKIKIRSARGGHPKVIAEYELYQKTVLQGLAPLPDILVVAIDTNCHTYQRTRRDINLGLKVQFKDRIALACPDPHIERWFLADPQSFVTVVGVEPRRERRKCGRDRYKQLLAEAIRSAGQIPTLGGVEFAAELVAAMDLSRACRNEPSLKSFVEDIKTLLHRFSQNKDICLDR